MSKNIFLFFSLFLLGINKSHAQLICSAKILNAKDGKIDACFTRTPNPIGNITKYTILASGVEIYEVEFTYYNEGDSILIKFYDKQNINVKLQCVRLKPEDSHFLICDFLPNQRQIDNKKNYQILFGIDNPNMQYMTLYQFKAIGGVQSQFILQDVPPNVINDHSNAVSDYEKIMNIRDEHDFSIRHLRKEMNNYKDSIINSITEKENAQKIKEATLVADQALQKEFTKKMDDIFLNYYKSIHSFNDESYECDFSFLSDGYGKIKIDAAKSIYFKNGSQKNWLRDSFMFAIKPLIEKGVFNTLTNTNTYPNLKSDFANWFENKFSSYSNLGEVDRDSFTLVKKYINDEFEPYITRVINIPTVYLYSFKYISSIKSVVWKYVKEKDGTEKLSDKSDKENRIDISENLKQIFSKKYGSGGSGKYYLKISSVSLNNDVLISQDIQLQLGK